MLDQIKDYYGFRTDSEFAAHLGVKPQVLSNWKSRKTFDAELVYNKCKKLNPAWLLCQEGSMIGGQHAVQEVSEGRMPYLLKKEINTLEKQLAYLQGTYKAIEKSKDFFLKVIQEIEQDLESKKKLLKKS
ncbi:helix-turn-helix domain-containing protein [Mesonia sp. MT50]|uniref:Helix-turn-helix domain-containing protein n=1 Tax=Mesonia profundi TaxID=3070998 RepID=A0ABU1A3Q3_9FLAO|nr:helix-turn-helix domain-containing protein [Mesonia profundi]MDQ7918254.1 helix-turn-helix domain-containing protein [Mesonia profundi]